MKQKNKTISNKVIKAGFWYTFSNFLVKGLAFITMPIFTRIMSKSDIGMFSNITSWFSILAILTTFEIYSSINIARFDYKDELDQYVSSTLILETIITLIFYIVVLIFHNFFQNLFMVNYQTLNIMFIYLLVYPAVQTYQIRKQIDYDYQQIIKVSIFSAIASTFFSVIFVLFFKDKLMGRVYGYFIPLIIISIYIYFLLLKKGKNYSKKYWKYAIVISFPLIWHLLAGYLLSSADKIMITRLISADANSLYSVAYMISQIAALLWSSMNNAWSPWAYKQMDIQKFSNLKEKSKPYTILYLFVIGIMILIAPELLLIMGGTNYINAKYVMPPVMIGYVFQFVYSFYVNIEFYHKKQKNIAIGTILAAIINIVLNFIFIPLFGYIAAAYTTLVGYILLFFIHLLFVKKIGCIGWYDLNFFKKVLFFSLTSIPFVILLYKFNVLRYILIFAIIVCFVIKFIKNYSEIIKIFKEKDLIKLLKLFKVGKGNKI